MHASTWHRTPARAAIPAISVDRVHHPVGVRRCGGDDEHGAVVDGLGHGRRVGTVVGRRRAPRGARHRSSARPCGRRRAPSWAPRGSGSRRRAARHGRSSPRAGTTRSRRRSPTRRPRPAHRAGPRRSRRARSPCAAATGRPSGRGRWCRRRPPAPRARPRRRRAARCRRRRRACVPPFVGRSCARSSSMRARRSSLTRLLPGRPPWPLVTSSAPQAVAAQPHQRQQHQRGRQHREAQRDRVDGGGRLVDGALGRGHVAAEGQHQREDARAPGRGRASRPPSRRR